MSNPNWKKDEVDLLRKLYATTPACEIAKQLGRSSDSVSAKAVELRLTSAFVMKDAAKKRIVAFISPGVSRVVALSAARRIRPSDADECVSVEERERLREMSKKRSEDPAWRNNLVLGIRRARSRGDYGKRTAARR